MGLNPCCSGRWSRTLCEIGLMPARARGLNPCCSGRWSRTDFKMPEGKELEVLILVVVDDGLVPSVTQQWLLAK